MKTAEDEAEPVTMLHPSIHRKHLLIAGGSPMNYLGQGPRANNFSNYAAAYSNAVPVTNSTSKDKTKSGSKKETPIKQRAPKGRRMTMLNSDAIRRVQMLNAMAVNNLD